MAKSCDAVTRLRLPVAAFGHQNRIRGQGEGQGGGLSARARGGHWDAVQGRASLFWDRLSREHVETGAQFRVANCKFSEADVCSWHTGPVAIPGFLQYVELRNSVGARFSNPQSPRQLLPFKSCRASKCRRTIFEMLRCLAGACQSAGTEITSLRAPWFFNPTITSEPSHLCSLPSGLLRLPSCL